MWYAIAIGCGFIGGAVAMYFLAPKLAGVQAKVKAAISGL